MKPKILLVNYSITEAKAVENETGFKILRGYLGESKGSAGEGTSWHQIIKFYSPEAFYECDMIFVKLPATEALTKEFDELAVELNNEDQEKFRNYWKQRKRLMTVYVGDTNIRSLWCFGIPVTLEKSTGNDTRTETWSDDTHELTEIIQQIDSSIKMPTVRYIQSGYKENKDGIDMYYNYNTRWTNYSWNVNGDYLAVAMSKTNGDYSKREPGAIIIGLPKKISTITNKIIRFFGDYMEIFSVGDDWKTSDEFYPPNILGKLNTEEQDILREAKRKYQEKKNEIKELKANYSYLLDIVATQGAPLADAVKKSLEDVLSLNVTDADQANPGEPIEDLYIELAPERQLSVEIKGTTKPHPPLEYTQQPFQHIARRGYGSSVEPVLILNYDMNKSPSQRAKSYTDKDKEPLISKLHFIDTRELLKVLKDVIDNKITKEDGIAILFNNLGRVEYDYDSHQQNKLTSGHSIDDTK